ncbi:MAG TPA: glycosyltransferase family 1 protein [Armatimonadota bacterium]|nr:glycosyltransferase family 1 protein [Armatimonadota bacterium]
MRIGIDARFLTHPQDGGFKTYTQNIVHGLEALDDQNQYFLYTDRPGAESAYTSDNFSVRAICGPAPVREQFLLPAAMSQDKIDIAHYLCNTAAVKKNCSLVLTVHDLIPCMPRQRGSQKPGLKARMLNSYWRSIMPKAAKRADAVITISQASKSDICRMLHVPENRITVIPTGLHPDFAPIRDLDEIQRVRKEHHLPEKYVLGFVSSDPRKNCQGIIMASELAARILNDVVLVLICASHEAKEMALSFASQYETPKLRMILLDPVPRRDLAIIYSQAEVLLFPSFYEGFGLPVIEAMACDTPVIISNISSLPEVAGDAALLVNPNDPKHIAEALVQVLQDQKLQADLIAKGRQRVTNYGWERTARETVAVYEKVYAQASAKASNNTIPGGSAG